MSELDKTQVPGQAGSLDKTQVSGNQDLSRTSTSESQIGPPQPMGMGKAGADELTRTRIGDNSDGSQGELERRRFTGWLVTYELDPFGRDYRIHEGRNVLGRNEGCEISFPEEEAASGIHATLLCKNGVFFLRDEMSSNGTFLNGEELRPDEVREIKDSDVIGIGRTSFKFKVAI